MSEVLKNRLETIMDALVLIENRLVCINAAEDFVETEQGLLIMDAIAMRLQVIGETVKKVDQDSPGLFSKYEIDPQPIIRFRDFISHHYDEADNVVLYNICTAHLPPLKQNLTSLLSSLS